MKRLINAWRRRPIITTGFALAVVFTGLFAVRAVTMMVYWSDPDHRDQAIQGWMTPRYVAQSWHLPPRVMYEALGTEEMPGRRKTLGDIAAERGISVKELSDQITRAADSFRETGN